MIKNALRTTLLAGLALACSAPVAGADSIVFIDGGNVAVSQPDGSGKVQLTDGGGWHSPTQSDNGTIAAVNDVEDIVVMAKDGRVIRKIDTPSGVKASNGGYFSGTPVNLSFSPDGTKIAYAYVEALCPPASTCGTQRSTFYTHVDSDTATPVETYGNQFGVSEPEWIDNNRTLVFGGAFKQVNIDTLNSGDYNYSLWFSKDEPGEFVSDGELSRSGDRFAALYGYGDEVQMAFFSGGPGAAPEQACASGDFDPKYADPSWSPDSSSLAFASSKGVEVIRFTQFGPNTCAVTGSSVVIAPGASEPDWGPAEPATGRFVERKDDQQQVNTGNNQVVQQQQVVTPTAVQLLASGSKRQRFRGTLSIGCTASVAGTCEAVAAVKVGRKTIRSKVARKQVAAGQRATLRLRFSPKNAKAIRKALRRGKARATITLLAGGATAKHTVTLTR
jgi:WD40-like Beta Propeller Repeat